MGEWCSDHLYPFIKMQSILIDEYQHCEGYQSIDAERISFDCFLMILLWEREAGTIAVFRSLIGWSNRVPASDWLRWIGCWHLSSFVSCFRSPWKRSGSVSTWSSIGIWTWFLISESSTYSSRTGARRTSTTSAATTRWRSSSEIFPLLNWLV